MTFWHKTCLGQSTSWRMWWRVCAALWWALPPVSLLRRGKGWCSVAWWLGWCSGWTWTRAWWGHGSGACCREEGACELGRKRRSARFSELWPATTRVWSNHCLKSPPAKMLFPRYHYRRVHCHCIFSLLVSSLPSANEVSRSGWQQLQWVSPSRAKLRGLQVVECFVDYVCAWHTHWLHYAHLQHVVNWCTCSL